MAIFPDDAQITSGGSDESVGIDDPIQDLVPGSDGHERLMKYLMARIELSSRHMSSRHDDWGRVDEAMQMYIDLSRPARRGNRTDKTDKKETPFERSIMIPVTYAIHSVRRAMIYSLFANRMPVMRISARQQEQMQIDSARNMEAVLDYDMMKTKFHHVIYSMIGDADKYGVGVVYDYFESEYGDVPAQPSLEQWMQGIEPPPERGIITQYNKWTNVDPYLYIPDPRTPLARLQDSEFQGHTFFRPYTYLLENQIPNGSYFNIDKIKKMGASGIRSGGQLGRSRFSPNDFMLGESADAKDRGYVAIDMLQCRIVPSDWGLSPSTVPEIWWFALANESTIIRCHKSPYKHNQFTYSVAQVEPDPHIIANMGMAEMLDGMQRTINWFYNSHIENTRKLVNDALIVAPSLIEMDDLLHPKPARHIRLTELGERLVSSGMISIEQMYSQLNAADVTGPHLALVAQLYDLANRMASINDPMQGQPTDPERTLGEVQIMSRSAGQRLAVVAQLIDTMGVSDLARRAIVNRQQFTTQEQFYRLVGQAAGQGSTLIGPDDIQGEFDYIPHSALSPDDPRASAEALKDILTQAAQAPQLFQPDPMTGEYLDPKKIFVEIAKNEGIKDIQSMFSSIPPPILQMMQQFQQMQAQGAPQVASQEHIDQQVKAGNAVPVSQVQQ